MKTLLASLLALSALVSSSVALAEPTVERALSLPVLKRTHTASAPVSRPTEEPKLKRGECTTRSLEGSASTQTVKVCKR